MKPDLCSISRRGFTSLLTIAFVILTAEASLIPRLNAADSRFQSWDCQRYLAIANGRTDSLAREAPFCWRVLVPSLVRLLPFSTERSFFLLTFVSLLAATAFLLLYTRALGLPLFESAAVLLFFLFSRWITGYLFYDYALVDAEAFAFIFLLLWLGERRAPLAVTVPILILGMMCKEQVLVAGIYLSVKYWKQGANKQEKYFRSVLPIGACIIEYAAVRLTVAPSNDYRLSFEILHRFDSLNPPGYFHFSLRQWLMFVYDGTFGTWGAIALSLLYSAKRFFRIVKEKTEYLVPIVFTLLQVLLAWNLERLLVYAFPFVIVPIVTSLRTSSRSKRIRPEAVLWGIVLLQMLLYFHFLLASHGYDITGARQLIFSIGSSSSQQ